VIDADLGISGKWGVPREGFTELVTRVCTGEVGAIFGIEITRLARSNADVARLAEFARITGTLLIDPDGVYDPADVNDRVILGFKGTMGESLCRNPDKNSSGSPSKRSYAWEEADITAGHGSRVPVHPVSPGAALTCATPVKWKALRILMRTSPLCRPGGWSTRQPAMTGRNVRHNHGASRNVRMSSAGW
jgi:hypothetical protein